MRKQYHSLGEAAHILGVSNKTFRLWLRDLHIVAARDNADRRSWCISSAQLELIVRHHARSAPPEPLHVLQGRVLRVESELQTIKDILGGILQEGATKS